MEKISFVIPCYGSEKTITAVISEIHEVMLQKKDNYDYEIITVNDGSPDHVYEMLKDIACRDQRVKVIDFSQNMGQHAALMAGYSVSSGDIVVTMDDDGQTPLDRLWDLLDPLFSENADVALAEYGRKKESLFRNIGSILNNKMATVLIGKPKELQMCSFAAMKRFVVDEILKYKGPYPYIGGLMLRVTKNIVNVKMQDRERAAGTSGYSLKKLIRLILNGFTAFSVKPLRLASVFGLIVACLGFISAVVTIIRKIMVPEIAAGWSSIFSALLIIGGIIMLILGIIGEYIGRIYICINNSPQYVIRETINIDKKDVEQ